ncbi:hypothetical protein B0J15DRAFT_409195 [Fusarium solani]|uniref:NWD NACHT-NTPase N-terminal domain-containing protein n=1 Tax=Fusarium solani TaxID=169388 RepID=A0A9P9G3I6_FUSSL|nr:uncharacterized protein B0J15DRAFT_409195 [Fusarium solani]KAH7232414.1 hypothetical protein B0J15DRAFT_409195 [Fusarium solani]
MAPKLSCRWRNVFRRHGKPGPEKSKRDGPAVSSTDTLNSGRASRNPQALAKAEHLPPEPTVSSAADPSSSAPKPAPSTAGPSPTVSIRPPASLESRTSPTQLEQSGPAVRSLWDRAYDALREKDARLVEEYEKLLSRELPKTASSSDAPNDDPDDAETNLDKTDNQIDNSNLENRQEQLKAIIGRGLRRMEEKKIKYTICGHEFVPRDQIAHAAGLVQGMKTLVDEAVRASPEASLVWAGVCVILPILTNPRAAEQANQDGFTYVTSRMRLYVELEPLLWPANLKPAAELKIEFEDRIVNLYQHVLDFQFRSVLRFYRTWLARLGRDVVQHEDWKEMLSKVRELERAFDNDLKKNK